MKIYEAWDALKAWLDRYDSEEVVGVDLIRAKIEELESAYE